MKPFLRTPVEVVKWSLLVAAAIVAALQAAAQGAGEDVATYAAWKRHRDAVAEHPAVVRYYTFEGVSAHEPVAPSRAGREAPLRYGGADTLERVEGRRAQRQAVRLDRGSFEGKPFEVRGRSFTVEMWFRKHGQGGHLGNGRTNGMLFAQGDGYWNGMRVWTAYPARDLHFEIGRPKPGHSFGFSAPGPVPDGVWHHLAATWDGRQMRLYLNGILLRAAEYAGEYTPPAGPLRIGFAGAGVGSVKMDVDEFAAYETALSPAEILRHAHLLGSLPGAVETRLAAGTAAVASGDWAEVETQFAGILGLSDVPPAIRTAARMAVAQSLRNRGRMDEAIAQYAAIFERSDAPEPLRQIAVRNCIPSGGGPVQALASRGVYERLLELDELSEAERIATRLALAECHVREGDAAAARRQYERVLEMPGLSDRKAWNVRLQIVHAYLAAEEYAAARAEYAKLADRAEAPPELRSMARLCVGHTYFREKAYGEAGKAFATACKRCELPHHRREAADRAVLMRRMAKGESLQDASAAWAAPPHPAPAPAGITFHVAPEGDDGNPGTADRPFATLRRARDAVREVKSKQGLSQGGAAVVVRGGSYVVSETLKLTEADSGEPEAPIVYRAAPGETPRFTGGVELAGFKPVADRQVLARLPEEARAHVRQVDLKRHGVTDYGNVTQRGFGLSGYPAHPWVDLYVDGQAMTLAQWPNEGFVEVGKVHRGRFRSEQSGAPGEFQYEDDRPSRWAKAEDPWMFGYWGHLWAGRSVEIAQIDPERRRIATVQPVSYGFREGQPYYYFNVLEELDRPGEWYLDRSSGVLYLYPPVDLDGVRVQFPVFSAPFVKMENASHVTLRGLTFELGRTEGTVIEGGEGNLLAGCTFRQLGTNGVIVQGGSDHGILGCDLVTLGAGGCRVAGGDRGTLTPGGHFVENCHVGDFSRVDRVYAPAVHLDGVGNRIAHNLFHDSPHHAMRVEGYEHTIEMNEVHSVVYEADDQAGVDMFGNPAYRGNVIRYNFWHHIGSGHNVAGQAGIRLDDFISAVLVYGNVFYRCAGGRFGAVQIHGGKDNVVDNNLFVDCKYAVSFSPWGQKRWLERLGRESTQAAVARGGVDVTRPPHSTRYPDLARMAEGADRNFLWRNLAVDCGRFAVRDRGVNEWLDNHATSGDAKFVDRARLDFTLREDSPLYDRLGFAPIPFREIGLYPSETRASWPVEHEVTRHYFEEE